MGISKIAFQRLSGEFDFASLEVKPHTIYLFSKWIILLMASMEGFAVLSGFRTSKLLRLP